MGPDSKLKVDRSKPRFTSDELQQVEVAFPFARRERLRAAVGPCIAPQSYEVGLEFLDRFIAEDPAFEAYFAPAVSAEKRMFDLPGFVLGRLGAAGVAQCEWVGRDTCAEADLFFSNRRAFKQGEPDYGRLLSAIMLEP